MITPNLIKHKWKKNPSLLRWFIQLKSEIECQTNEQQLRKFFPKVKSIDYLTREKVHDITTIIDKYVYHHLQVFLPNEALAKVFVHEVPDTFNSI